MKVLQINSVCGIGSTGRIATDLDSVMRASGIESFIAYGRETSVVHDHIIKIGTKQNILVHGALTRIFDSHGLKGSERATRTFIEQVKRIDPDVIHLHNLHGYYINFPILFDYLKTSGKPVVWTLHDCWSFTGHCAYFSYVKCDKWLTGCHSCPQTRTYPASFFLDSSSESYSRKKSYFTNLNNMTLVTPSRWLAHLVENSFLSKYPVKVIHNGIDTSIFKAVDTMDIKNNLNIRDKFLILGVAHSWSERKGLKYFIKLSSKISRDSIIVLVGLTKKQIKTLPANIIGLARTADLCQLVQIYSAGDVLLNLSCEESFGLVTVEAMACGTPAIVFAETPGAEIVDDDRSGYIVRQDAFDNICNLINRIKLQGKEYYSDYCIAITNRLFDKHNFTQQYIDLYKSIIASDSISHK